MRILIALIIVQIALTAYVVLGFGELEERIETRSAHLPEQQSAARPLHPSTLPSPGSGTAPDSAEIRRIVREELQALRLDSARPAPAQPESGEAVYYDPAELAYRRERIGREIDFYKGRGEISSAEMDLLQVEISRLDPASREEMLGQLVAAINRGEIKGKF